MAEQQEEGEEEISNTSAFPSGRVKRIMKLDKDINKVNSESLFLISKSTELFIKFLAQKSAQVAIQKKRKTIKLDHLRLAVKTHQPTADFLLDLLPEPSQPLDLVVNESKAEEKSVPFGTRRIDHIFHKAV